MIGRLILITLSLFLFLGVVISCKKTENDIIMAPSLNCASTSLSTSAFINDGTMQSTTLSVGINNAVAGLITFNITSSSSDFNPATYTATIKDGQTTVDVPLTFDGTSGATSETIVVSAPSYASGYCSTVAKISAGSSTTATTDCSALATNTAKVVCAAEAFLATLTADQKAAVMLEYTKGNAIKWSNLPCGSSCRVGLQLANLTDVQVAAALAVLAAATGATTNEGYDEAMQIRAADDVLKEAGGGADGYSSGIYFIAFLGTPSTTSTWQFQFGGHHLAINKTFNAGTVQGATPHFEGVEPRSWTTTNGTVYTPLGSEHDVMAAMLASLTSEQLTSARLSSTFSDVVLGPANDGKFPADKVGIQVSSLSADQQTLVLAAMKPWVLDTDEATAASLLTIYRNELANTYIAYSGNASLTNNADYVRIDGPSVWIEFVCQSGVVYQNQIHYHSIWRDHTRDYGGNFTF